MSRTYFGCHPGPTKSGRECASEGASGVGTVKTSALCISSTHLWEEQMCSLPLFLACLLPMKVDFFDKTNKFLRLKNQFECLRLSPYRQWSTTPHPSTISFPCLNVSLLPVRDFRIKVVPLMSILLPCHITFRRLSLECIRVTCVTFSIDTLHYLQK